MVRFSPVKIVWGARALLFSIIAKRIGFPSYIGKPCFVIGVRGIEIGQRFRCFPGLRLEVSPGALLTVGNDVGFAQNVHIICSHCVTIGDGVRIAAQVAITDTKHRFRCNGVGAFDPADDEVSSIMIGKNTFIGTGAVIEAGTILGAECVVGANSYVRGQFPDSSILAGSPARVIGKRGFMTEL
ncbi:hypothetical protein J3456_16840 [Sulfitobacter sp. NFXS29]|uniref:acyltransferase n=1 Tax=Sulfitobacter sp. NFXS29 TaxID=2818438 RepID=UPI0032DFD9B4